MKQHFKIHPWKIIEDSFDQSNHQISESIFSIGNGRMGQRANFEESYSGDSLQGSYIAGIYYPDKTKVGWWKNGYPEYFAKVLNSVNWIGLKIKIDNEIVDLNKQRILDFNRTLDMKRGLLKRSVLLEIKGKRVRIRSERFYSLKNKNLGLLRYRISSDKEIEVKISSFLDSNVNNQDSNHGDTFWTEFESRFDKKTNYVKCVTKKTKFGIVASMINRVQVNGAVLKSTRQKKKKTKISESYKYSLGSNETIELTKHVAIVSTMYTDRKEGVSEADKEVKLSAKKGYKAQRASHMGAWSKLWMDMDVKIKGDPSAQQGIRFNLFQLNQTYQGDDYRLNIGPKGFTGEKYGGSTYWDTEAYCLPFYLSTSNQDVSKNLLLYRYNHLPKAIENAKLLGFTNGAALYPMVTMNGEECHNEWEITFEEIHRNGAIAYAIYRYIQYTADETILLSHGLEVLIAIARFWVQRANWSPEKKQYVILGVTGPNEYENNVNNNWYTNKIAQWCIKYAIQSAQKVRNEHPDVFDGVARKTDLKIVDEYEEWNEVSSNMFLPEDKKLGIFLQQDGYLDKECVTTDELKKHDRPINQNWSWDRILRSPYIKQADVLQGLYFFEDEFSTEEIRSNFDYYEPRTVHESSLSPCIHSILAARIGDTQKAYEMYLRTARLDLDNYNNDTEDGCHITSMAGTWMSVVEGFAGMRVQNNRITFAPFIPQEWAAYSFIILYRNSKIRVSIENDMVTIENLSKVTVYGSMYDYDFELKGQHSRRWEVTFPDNLSKTN